MHRVLPNPQQLALYNTASSRAIEAHAQARLASHALMAKAGLALAKLALAIVPHGGRIWVACGPGNNGGDGLVAATWLHELGWQTQVSLLRSDTTPPADAAWALSKAQAAGVPISDDPPDFQPDLIIDALLGLGSSRPADGRMADWIRRINSLEVPVLSADLPTGLHADSGRLLGDSFVRASHCLALLTLKPGLFTAHGRDCCGELWFDDLGCTPKAPADTWLLGRDCMAGVQRPLLASTHKGRQGDTLVIGGGPGMQGAARLAARSALAAGAGRVYACLLDPLATPDPTRAELMQWPLERLNERQAWQGHSLVAGCGAGTAIAAILHLLLAHAERLVLDADGLNALAADPALRALTAARRGQGLATILTPHPLEAARLLDCTSSDIQADRLAAAAALSRRYDCTVLLKGSGSIIASPACSLAINSTGGPALATAGTGDVLAGWLAGLWARQGDADPHELACAGAYWHGLAGDTQAAGPLRAGCLVEAMHALHGCAVADGA